MSTLILKIRVIRKIIKQIATSFSFLIIIYNGVRRSQLSSPAKDKKNVIDKEAYGQSLVRRFNKEVKVQFG